MGPILNLIILAGVAVFLILRLRSVLGTREGFEKPPLISPRRGAIDIAGDVVPEAALQERAQRLQAVLGDSEREFDDDSEDANHILAIAERESDFDVGEFLTGAGQAYEMILMAFEGGNLDSVRAFIAPDVFEAFESAVSARNEQGLRVEAQFLGLRRNVLHAAVFDANSGQATLSVRLRCDITMAVYNKQGDLVEGDDTNVKDQKGLWSFTRTLGDANPNWQLSSTGE